MRVHQCRACDLFLLVGDPGDLGDYLAAAYGTVDEGDNGFRGRRSYYEYLADVLESRVRPASRILDFGSAQGALMRVLRDRGFSVAGVEVNDEARDRCRAAGLTTYRSLGDVDDSHCFDAVLFIDSFYYCIRPLEVLEACHRLLVQGGVVIIRFSNRNPLVRAASHVVGMQRALWLLGDAFRAHSVKSMSRAFERSGYVPLEWMTRQDVGHRPWFVRWAYSAAYGLAAVTRGGLNWVPGVIAVAAKRGDERETG